MSRYAEVNTNVMPNVVVNVIALDDIGDYTPPSGHILVQSETAQIGDYYDSGTGEFTTPPPSKNQLKTEANGQISTFLPPSTLVIGGFTANMSSVNFPLIFTKIVSENLTDTRTILDATGSYQTVTNQDFIDTYTAYNDLLERVANVTKLVYADIDNEVLTTYEDVDSAVTTYWDAVSARADLTDVRELISEKEDQSDMLDALAGLDLAENEMVLGGSTADTFNLVTTGAMGRTLMGTADAAAVKTNLSLAKTDVGLGSVVNADTTTTANISDSSDKRFVTDAQKTVLGNTSGANTGDQDLSALALKATTVNGHALSANVTVSASDVGLGSVVNVDTSTTANISDSSGKRFVSDAQKTVLGNTSGTNTGDQDVSGLVTKTTTVNGHALSSNVTVTKSDVGLGNVDNTADASKTFTSSQISDFTEASQDVVGALISGASGIVSTYNDGANTLVISAPRASSSLSLSLVGSGATGTQISSTKDSTIRCTVSTSTTSSIGGPATSVIALKTCATNSATEGDWATIATLENDQTITLALTLNSVQVMKGQLTADVPAGYYVKLVNSGSGTHSESFVSGQKTVYG